MISLGRMNEDCCTVLSQLAQVGTSVRPCFINVHPAPSCLSACNQYRPSVQHLAESFVMTAHPAEPVKEVTWARLASQGARYSEASDVSASFDYRSWLTSVFRRDYATLSESSKILTPEHRENKLTMHRAVALASSPSPCQACLKNPKPSVRVISNQAQ